MSDEKAFDHKGRRYYTKFSVEDGDVRHIKNEDDDTVLTFDSSLLVFKVEGESRIHVGWLRSSGDEWMFQHIDSTKTKTGVKLRDYHWLAIRDAEIEVSKLLLP